MKMNQLAEAPQSFSLGEHELANAHSLKASPGDKAKVHKELK